MVTLNNEHRYLASLLEALSDQADRLLPGRTPDYSLMRDIARYMSDYPDEQHHPREDLLFEHLTRRDPESRDLVAQLQDGHREIYRRSRELLEELERATTGGNTVDNRRLKYLCDRYIGYYWEHINTEEGKLFPRATAKLRSEDWYAVNTRAKYVDDPLFGARVRKEYQRLAQHLATRVERATEEIAVAELFGVEALIEAVSTLGGALGEARAIVTRRTREAFGDMLGDCGERLDRREFASVLGIPVALFGNVREHGAGAWRELGAVASRTRGELAEPFTTRLAYLRKMIA